MKWFKRKNTNVYTNTDQMDPVKVPDVQLYIRYIEDGITTYAKEMLFPIYTLEKIMFVKGFKNYDSRYICIWNHNDKEKIIVIVSKDDVSTRSHSVSTAARLLDKCYISDDWLRTETKTALIFHTIDKIDDMKESFT